MRTVLNMKKPLLTALLALSLAPVSACADSTPDSFGIVATNSVLASIVQSVVGDSARVDTVIPDGKDPHEFQPSAGDVAKITNAKVVVANGFGYEPSLEKSIAAARANGVVVYDAEWDNPGLNEPHWFTDPLTAAGIAARMLPVLEKALGAELDNSFAAATKDFQNTTDEGQKTIVGVAGGSCTFGAEHVFLVPFTDRFGCRDEAILNMGSRSPDAEPSASDIERFVQTMKDRDIHVLVEDATEHSRILERVADETGAVLVTVNVHSMGPATTYREYILNIVNTLAVSTS